MIHNGIEYHTYDELKPIAIQVLRQRILDKQTKYSRYIGDINKMDFNKQDIGIELKNLGYNKKRIMKDGIMYFGRVPDEGELRVFSMKCRAFFIPLQIL